MRQKGPIALAIAAAFVCGSAQAELVQGTGYVTDTTSGLEWLNMSATENVNYYAIATGYGGYLANGWTVATGAQIQQLALGNIGVPTTVCEDDCGQGYPNESDRNDLNNPTTLANEVSLMASLGVTSSFSSGGVLRESVQGYYSDDAPGTVPPASGVFFEGNGNFTATISLADPSQSTGYWMTSSSSSEGAAKIDSQDAAVLPGSNYGTFLVREAPASVPAPETWALFGLGLAGILLTQRKRAVRAQ